MSVLAVCFHRRGRPVARSVPAGMLRAQRLPAGDDENILAEGDVALGCRALWTTPEEEGETQPLSVPGLPYVIVWDGRIDNREELFRHIDVGAPQHECSDAGLMLRLFAAKGTSLLHRIVGSFVFAVYDRRKHALTLARDAVGQRCLSYYITDDLFVAASEDAGVLSHPDVPKELNPGQLACFFSLMNLESEETYFKDVKKLLPGHCLTVDRRRAVSTRYWAPDWDRRIRYRDEREYAEHYRELLDRAVTCRTRAPRPIGVMTSGGLDSGPIAAIAAAAGPSSTRVHAFTWAFEQFPECNEGGYVSRLCDMWGMRYLEVPCDDCAPYRALESWPTHPDTPDQDPYRRFLDQTYDTASRNGVRVLLNGGGGDPLYAAGGRWFLELLLRGRLGQAFSGARWYVEKRGITSFFRHILIRSLLPAPVLTRLRPPRPPEWLTDRALSLLPDPAGRWPPGHQGALRPGQALACLSLRTGDFLAAETRWSDAYRVSVRYPMRDRRILEFMLAVPDDQLQFEDLSRPILRRAAADLLPAAQLNRRDKTSFDPVFDHGRRSAAPMIKELLEETGCFWPRFIRMDWTAGARSATQNRVKTLEWQAVSTELWRRRQHLTL